MASRGILRPRRRVRLNATVPNLALSVKAALWARLRHKWASTPTFDEADGALPPPDSPIGAIFRASANRTPLPPGQFTDRRNLPRISESRASPTRPIHRSAQPSAHQRIESLSHQADSPIGATFRASANRKPLQLARFTDRRNLPRISESRASSTKPIHRSAQSSAHRRIESLSRQADSPISAIFRASANRSLSRRASPTGSYPS